MIRPSFLYLHVVLVVGLMGCSYRSDIDQSLVGTWHIQEIAGEHAGEAEEETYTVLVLNDDGTWADYLFAGNPPHEYGGWESGRWRATGQTLTLELGGNREPSRQQSWREYEIVSSNEEALTLQQQGRVWTFERGAGPMRPFLEKLLSGHP